MTRRGWFSRQQRGRRRWWDDQPGKSKSDNDEDSGSGCTVPGKTNQSGLPLIVGATLLVLAARRARSSHA